jgi:hypothetical protein
MSPMTIVVVRDVPAGASCAGASAFVAVADFGASAVAGVEDVVALASGAGASVAPAEGVAAGEAVVCEKAEDETRARARARAESAGRRFISGETIEPAGTRQAGADRT